jgi:hypothetical protein
MKQAQHDALVVVKKQLELLQVRKWFHGSAEANSNDRNRFKTCMNPQI